MRNDVNNWQQVGFFIQRFKTKHNVLTSLHEFTKQNIVQAGRSSF